MGLLSHFQLLCEVLSVLKIHRWDVSVILLLSFYFNSISLFLSLPLSVSISSPHVLSFCFILSLSFSLFTSFFSFINAARIWDYVIPLFPWSWCPGKIWRRLGWGSYARQGFLFVRALLFCPIQIILYLLSCHHKSKMECIWIFERQGTLRYFSLLYSFDINLSQQYRWLICSILNALTMSLFRVLESTWQLKVLFSSFLFLHI